MSPTSQTARWTRSREGSPKRLSVLLPAPRSIHQYIDDMVEVARDGNVDVSYSTIGSATEQSFKQRKLSMGGSSTMTGPNRRSEGRKMMLKTQLLPPRPPSISRHSEISFQSCGHSVLSDTTLIRLVNDGVESGSLEDYLRKRAMEEDEDFDEFLYDK